MTKEAIAILPKNMKVKFLSKNIRVNGKKLSQKSWSERKDKVIDDICFKFHREFELEMKAPLEKYLVECDTSSFSVEARSEEQAMEYVRESGYNPVQAVKARGHYFCKYCSRIVKGTNKDVLCPECRDVFGHAFFSEL